MIASKKSDGEAEGVYIALMRGINVGGKNKLPNASLAEIFEQAGCVDIRTYIQSGNVIFRATEEVAKGIPETVSRLIAERRNLSVPVIMRTFAEIRSVVKNNPFIKSGVDPAKLHVAFPAGKPDKSAIAALDPDRSPPDEFVVRGAEIFLHFPNGAARTKITNAYLDSKLGTISTIRNWKTVLKLLDFAEAI